MLDAPLPAATELNSYNVAQLQAADKDISYLAPDPDAALIVPDYDTRRMSTSAASADTESSSLSLSEKPTQSPPSRSQHWDVDGAEGEHEQSKVSLPSIFTTFEDSYRPERRASLPTLSSNVRHQPYPASQLRQPVYAPSSLSSYTFPPNNSESGQERGLVRPSVSTDLRFDYDNGYPSGTTPGASAASSTTSYSAHLSPYNESDHWTTSPSGIVRPSSTPGQMSQSPAVKYEDGLRHSSFSGQMFAHSARISGHHLADRRSLSSGIKGEWFPQPEYPLSGYPSMPPAPTLNSGSRSPQGGPASVDRPTRKRGKLPKETTDFLKSWLHRHSDHPYPSEEEKKQLCHATGLSMSQVSNWMINARRRILAPAHRAAASPTTTAPYPSPAGRSASLNGLMDARRASLPSADSLQLYHPMTLQSLPSAHPHHPHHPHHGPPHSAYPHGHDMGYRGPPLRMGPGVGLDYGPRPPMYAGGPGTGNAYGVPLSAPASMAGPGNPFSPPPGYHLPSPREEGRGGGGGGAYFDGPPPPAGPGGSPNPGHSPGANGHDSAPGSGYGTPQ